MIAATASLCYCVHKEIDHSEEIMTVVEVRGQRPKAAVAAFFESSLGGASTVSAIPNEEKEEEEEEEEDMAPSAATKNKNMDCLMESILPPESEPTSEGRKTSDAASTATPSPTPPPSQPSQPPPPSLVVQVLPPTPTSGPTTPSPSAETSEWPRQDDTVVVEATVEGQRPNDDSTADITPNAAEVKDAVCSKQRSIIPKLTLPLIRLSTEDDDDNDDPSVEERPSGVKGQRPKAEEEPQQQGRQGRGRKRRKSLVNMLFAKGSGGGGGGGGDESQLSTPTIEAPQGQRLHFRRVSEVFSLGLGGHRRDSRSACVSPAVTPADCSGGLSIRNLFPYRHGVFELESG